MCSFHIRLSRERSMQSARRSHPAVASRSFAAVSGHPAVILQSSRSHPVSVFSLRSSPQSSRSHPVSVFSLRSSPQSSRSHPVSVFSLRSSPQSSRSHPVSVFSLRSSPQSSRSHPVSASCFTGTSSRLSAIPTSVISPQYLQCLCDRKRLYHGTIPAMLRSGHEEGVVYRFLRRLGDGVEQGAGGVVGEHQYLVRGLARAAAYGFGGGEGDNVVTGAVAHVA